MIQERMSQERRAVVLLVLAAVLWSLAGVLIKSLTWHPLAIAGARSTVAAIVLLSVVRRRNFTWSAAQLGAAVAYAVTATLFVVANKLTTAANAILLQYTAPLWIALFSPWLLREHTPWYDWPIMGVILGGIVLFFCDHLTVSGLWGNILALVTGASFGWLALLLRKQKDSSPVESIWLGNVLIGLVGLPFAGGTVPTAHGSVGLALVLLGVLGAFQLGLSYLLYTSAIRHVTALEAMLIPAIEPILNPLLVLLTLGERPGGWALVGGALVLGAVAVRAWLAAYRSRIQR